MSRSAHAVPRSAYAVPRSAAHSVHAVPRSAKRCRHCGVGIPPDVVGGKWCIYLEYIKILQKRSICCFLFHFQYNTAEIILNLHKKSGSISQGSHFLWRILFGQTSRSQGGNVIWWGEYYLGVSLELMQALGKMKMLQLIQELESIGYRYWSMCRYWCGLSWCWN